MSEAKRAKRGWWSKVKSRLRNGMNNFYQRSERDIADLMRITRAIDPKNKSAKRAIRHLIKNAQYGYAMVKTVDSQITNPKKTKYEAIKYWNERSKANASKGSKSGKIGADIMRRLASAHAETTTGVVTDILSLGTGSIAARSTKYAANVLSKAKSLPRLAKAADSLAKGVNIYRTPYKTFGPKVLTGLSLRRGIKAGSKTLTAATTNVQDNASVSVSKEPLPQRAPSPQPVRDLNITLPEIKAKVKKRAKRPPPLKTITDLPSMKGGIVPAPDLFDSGQIRKAREHIKNYKLPQRSPLVDVVPAKHVTRARPQKPGQARAPLFNILNRELNRHQAPTNPFNNANRANTSRVHGTNMNNRVTPAVNNIRSTAQQANPFGNMFTEHAAGRAMNRLNPQRNRAFAQQAQHALGLPFGGVAAPLGSIRARPIAPINRWPAQGLALSQFARGLR